MSMRSALGRIRGLGSAKSGTGHWWSQRLSALALIPLTLWFVFSIAAMAGADLATIQEWLSSPLSASLMVLVVVTTFYHANLGLQVVIEDYVHDEPLKLASLIIVKGLCILCALAGVLSVLALLLGS